MDVCDTVISSSLHGLTGPWYLHALALCLLIYSNSFAMIPLNFKKGSQLV